MADAHQSPLNQPATGYFDATNTHILNQRVYYEDTDFSGVVYHARYLHFMERGRTEALRNTGSGQAALVARQSPLVFAVHKITITFRGPARMDDALEVRTRCISAKGARMVFDQRITRGVETLIVADVVVAAMTPEGRPQRIPSDLLEMMQRVLSPL